MLFFVISCYSEQGVVAWECDVRWPSNATRFGRMPRSRTRPGERGKFGSVGAWDYGWRARACAMALGVGLRCAGSRRGNGPEWHRLYHERLLVPCDALNSIFAVIGIGSATESLHTPSDRVAT